MLYKFKSQAWAVVIMLEINGDQMLSIIGKTPSEQGIITVAKIPDAIAALEAEIVAHEEAESRLGETPLQEAEGDSVVLRHRIAPFIALLRNSAEAGKDVVWGV